jgi:hypothetical protein
VTTAGSDPKEWRDAAARGHSPTAPTGPRGGMCDAAPYWPAFMWCTGTTVEPSNLDAIHAHQYSSDVVTRTESTVQIGTSSCPPTTDVLGTPIPPEVLTSTQVRVAVARADWNPDFFEPGRVVTVTEQTSTTRDMQTPTGCKPWPHFGSLVNEWASSSMAQFPGSFDQQDGDWFPWDREFLTIRQCGQVQRVSTWNQSCDSVRALFPGVFDGPSSHLKAVVVQGRAFQYDVLTGAAVIDLPNGVDLHGAPKPGEKRCEVREPWSFRTTCPGSSVCNANGMCVPAGVGALPLSINIEQVPE